MKHQSPRGRQQTGGAKPESGRSTSRNRRRRKNAKAGGQAGKPQGQDKPASGQGAQARGSRKGQVGGHRMADESAAAANSRGNGRPARLETDPRSQAGDPHGRKTTERSRHPQRAEKRPRQEAAHQERKGDAGGFRKKQFSQGGKPSVEHGSRTRAGRPDASHGAPPPLRQDILRLLAERPLDKIEITEALRLAPAMRTKLLGLLRDMELAGDVARIRKDRFIIPQAADLLTGNIQFHASGTAHVLSEKTGEPDLFISPENSFTAMHGDRVVARVERGKGRRPGAAPVHEGRVIRILNRANETIVGTLQKSKNFFYLVADDPRFVHNLYIQAPVPPLSASIGDKVVAHLDSWPSRHVNPEGHIIEVLGPVGKPGVDMLSIIRKHQLPTDFPPAVLQEAGRVSPEVDPHEAGTREDLRGKFIFTIDPDDAKDFDDAIDVERTASGWKLGIHIADVSHYVRPKTTLDREAHARGNSVYLADRVIPMLPEALSNGICSLKPGV
ncbi:MAG: RNB domain-containing ribonuclease, partial [Terrimicrobiaceae bacterium]|nr:RNB domain-containing ribonuclease [Terrimicrobiaceae bacterium]